MGVLVSDISRNFARGLSIGDSVIVPVMGIHEVLGQPVASSNSECLRRSHAADEARAAEKQKTAATKTKKSAQR